MPARRMASSSGQPATADRGRWLPDVAPDITHPASGTPLTVGEPVTLVGTAAPGAKVQLYLGGSLLGEAITASNGKWTSQLTMPLPEGQNVLRATVVRAAGQDPLPSDMVHLLVEPLVAPVVAYPTDGASLIAGEPLQLSGSAEPGARVRVYDGGDQLGEALADDAGRWTYALSEGLTSGPHALRAVVTNESGTREASSQTLHVNGGEAALAPIVLGPVDGTIVEPDETVIFEGTAAPGATLRLYDGNRLVGETTADSDGAWTANLVGELLVGDHALRAVVLNDARQEVATSGAVAVTIRQRMDAPSVLEPASGASFASGEPLTFAGTAAAGTTVRLYDGEEVLGEALSDGTGAWRLDSDEQLAVGGHELRVAALGAAGEEAVTSAVTPFTVLAAVQPVVNAEARRGVEPGGTVTGTAAPAARLQIYDGQQLLGETTADAAGVWQFALPTDLEASTHTLRAVAVSNSGQPLAESAALQLDLTELKLPVTGNGWGRSQGGLRH